MRITGTFTSFDKAEIFYRVWNYSLLADKKRKENLPDALEKGSNLFKQSYQPHNLKALIVIHRGHEHSERLTEMAEHPLFAEYVIFAFDMRGHGYTKAKATPWTMDSVRDLDAFAHYLIAHYGFSMPHLFVVANSIGGVIASSWALDFAPSIAGMALLAPAFKINLLIPFAKEAIEMGIKFKKNLTIKSYVTAKKLTHDKAEQAAYDADPLITRDIDARYLVDLATVGERLVSDAAILYTPTLILSAEKDVVAINDAQKRFFINLSSPLKEWESLSGFLHGILFEERRELVYEKLADFIKQAFKVTPSKPNLKADPFTVKESEQLRLGVTSPLKKQAYGLQKKLLNQFGYLSEGMKTGLNHGFDSGVSLDYIYKNTPHGKGLIGKCLDKAYLQAVGWQGIRQRRDHLLQLVEEKIIALQQKGLPVKLLDIAGGPGNYHFTLKEQFPDSEIVINDYSRVNVEKGEALLAEKGYQQMRFTNFDAFNQSNYKKMEITPNIVIISGVFELFSDNKLLGQALRGLKGIIDKKASPSYLIYTGQPWHPQLEQIAFVLNNHQGIDWVMRRRPQRELDTIMAYYGWIKERMLIDNYGIFTVSSASFAE